MEQALGWSRLAGAELGELVTVAQLAEVTGLGEGTVRRQLGDGRWGIVPRSRRLDGALEYPAVEVLARALGPGRGNRISGAARSEAVRRSWLTRLGE
jgi:hypothetical protein